MKRENTIYTQKLRKEKMLMTEQKFMRVEEVAQELGISKSYAYKIVHQLNAELREKGFLTISGRVSRQYFMEKLCYGSNEGRNQ